MRKTFKKLICLDTCLWWLRFSLMQHFSLFWDFLIWERVLYQIGPGRKFHWLFIYLIGVFDNLGRTSLKNRGQFFVAFWNSSGCGSNIECIRLVSACSRGRWECVNCFFTCIHLLISEFNSVIFIRKHLNY